MSVLAVGSVATEASVVPGTIFDLRLGIQVEKFALFVAALREFRVEVALGHFVHVILVQEFAVVSLFAKAAQPMLAQHRLVASHVSEGTLVAFVAC